MRRLLHTGLAVVLAVLLSTPTLQAAGKGGGKGGGGKKTTSSRRISRPTRQRTIRTKRIRPAQDSRSTRTTDRRGGGKHDRDLRTDRRGGGKRDGDVSTDRRGGSKRDGDLRGAKRDGATRPGRDQIDRSSLEGLKGRDRAFELQRLNEGQKLNHRLDNAGRLRELSERNGNTRLSETADRMEQNAYDQYDRRMDRIDQQQARFKQNDGSGDTDADSGSDGDGDSGESNGDADNDAMEDDSAHEQGEDARRGDDGDANEQHDGDDANDSSDVPEADRRVLNEERKLNHRLGQADHLRQVAQRNGNPKLLETADRMEQKAWDHYDKRMTKLGRGGDGGGDSGDSGGDGSTDPDDGDDGLDSHDGEDSDSTAQNDGDRTRSDRSASAYEGSRKYEKHLANEQRKLDKRLQQAEHLRGIARRNGNPNLMRTADRMEQKAFDHYDRRLAKIGRQEGLADLSTDPLPDNLDSTQASRYGQFLQRQLSYEEQRLNNRMETVQRVRDWADRTGNQDLLGAADRLEQRALDDYQSRVDRFDAFQEQYSQLDGVFSSTGESYWQDYDPQSYRRFRRIFGR